MNKLKKNKYLQIVPHTLGDRHIHQYSKKQFVLMAACFHNLYVFAILPRISVQRMFVHLQDYLKLTEWSKILHRLLHNYQPVVQRNVIFKIAIS